MNEKTEPQVAAKPPALPTHDLFFQLVNRPLYLKFPIVGDNPEAQIRRLCLHTGKFDMYCPSCKKHTTWTPIVSDAHEMRVKLEKATFGPLSSGPVRTNWLEQFTLRIVCARTIAHVADFYFEVVAPNLRDRDQKEQLEPTNLLKVGQFPSLSDFKVGDLDEFKEGMNDHQRKEFGQAIHTSAHGFSVAACVYYRRVFESILIEARDQHMAENKMKAWPEFEKAKIDQRIKLLKTRLPEFLCEHPHLYKILSLGVHQLTEEQCAQELPTLRQAIELILRDRVTAIRKQKDREAISRMIAQSVNRNKDR